VRGLALVTDYVPHIVLVRRKLESRQGSATSDTAGALVDATNNQFLSSDVGKAVYNASTYRWGIVIAYVSASQLTLDHDLFPDGDEAYYIYNEGCHNNKQVNISGFPGYREIKRAEYPVGEERGIDRDINGIVQIAYDGDVPDSSTVDDASENVIVHLYLKRNHFISQMTDFAAAINNVDGYAAGSTSMVLDALESSITIKRGQPFTIAGVPGEYTITDDVAVSGSAATISFFPGLEVAATDDDVVTFTKSTLTPELEPIFDDWCAAKMMSNKSAVLGVKQFINAANTVRAARNFANEEMERAERKLEQIAIRNSEPTKVLARL
jgi:hypothetical protein